MRNVTHRKMNPTTSIQPNILPIFHLFLSLIIQLYEVVFHD